MIFFTFGNAMNFNETSEGTESGAEPTRDCVGVDTEKGWRRRGREKAGRRNDGNELDLMGSLRSCL